MINGTQSTDAVDKLNHTLQSLIVSTAAIDKPTLWRTCRVLANRTRLQILALLHREPGLSVSHVAGRIGSSIPTASQALRALESRGLLAAQRKGPRVHYRPKLARPDEPLHDLTHALRELLGRELGTDEAFRIVTAFTHPRRIAMVRQLGRGSLDAARIRTACRVSSPAVTRHLRKLRSRGVVLSNRHGYELAARPNRLLQALIQLART